MGAVATVANVLRALHGSELPLNASEVARAAGLHRGTAYNILRTLQAEGFVGYDEAMRSYSVSLHIFELAYGVLRRSGLLDSTISGQGLVGNETFCPYVHKESARNTGSPTA